MCILLIFPYSDHVTRIFTSVNMNKKNSIVHVDLSNNHLDDKGEYPLPVDMVMSVVCTY